MRKHSHLPPGYRKTSSCVYRGYFYLIWRLDDPDDDILLSPQVKDKIRESVYAASSKYDVEIELLAVWKESVHLLCSIPPKYAPFTIVDNLKNSTAEKLGKEIADVKRYPWADDFFAHTIGYEHLEETKRMIEKGMTVNGNPKTRISKNKRKKRCL